MGLLDSLQFDTSSFGGQGGGLLDMIRSMQMQNDQYQSGPGFAPQQPVMQPNQPSPLDSAQWPAGPQGAPQQQASPVGVGNYQMPRIGSQASFSSDPAALPTNAQETQGMGMPGGPAMDAGQSQQQVLPPAFGNQGQSNFMTGLRNLGHPGGIINKLADAAEGFSTGKRTDAQGIAQQNLKAQYDALVPMLGPQKAMLAVMNPEAGKILIGQALEKHQYGFTTLPDGTVVRQDPQTGRVEPAYQSTPKTNYAFQTLPDGTIVRQNAQTGAVEPAYQTKPKGDWGVVGKQDGNEVYGWIDKNTREVTPVSTNPDRPETITGPDGKPIVVPPGVDRKTFVNEVSRANAKAAAGEKTEVQAKNEKFGNQMELAERQMVKHENEGTSYLSRATEGTSWLPGSATVGRAAQTEDYQKYVQARNSFITALLRDESGAAIGSQEFDRREKEMFPQPGDGPAVIEQKRELRKVAIDGMKKAAGPAYKSPESAQPSTSSGGNKTKNGVSWGVIQ